MKKVENKTINETYYVETLDNGLKVILYPKNDFYRTYAIFATKYGAQDIEFTPLNSETFMKTPEGIAHFLEHKLFENEDGTDASTLFAKNGADVNAFTTVNETAYLFSATSNIEENIELLLDFVQEPCFKKESIERERGIIEQELLMYLDQPQSVQYYGILKGMYKENSVRNEIGGTPESIKEIDDELLYTCYNTFYHPSNMQLVVVGKFDLEKTMNLIQNNQKRKVFEKAVPIKRRYHLEDQSINESLSYVEMDVNIPKVSVGLKLPYQKRSSIDNLKLNIALEILMDIYFDEASDNYEHLMKEGTINHSFSYEDYCEENYCHVIFTLDTNQPDIFIHKIKEVVDQIKHNHIDEEIFMTYKQLYQARNIKRFNSLEYIANLMVEFEQSNLTLFDLIDTTNRLTIDDVRQAKQYFDSENMASFIIYPKKQR